MGCSSWPRRLNPTRRTSHLDNRSKLGQGQVMSDLPAPPSELTSRVDLARKLAEIAAKVTLPLFRQHGETIDKAGPGDFDPVTKADRDAEAAMRDYLARAAPDDGIKVKEGIRAE